MKTFKLFAVLLTALSLTGCASTGLKTAMSYTPKVTPFEFESETWRMFEHPDKNRIMVTTSIGTAFGAGAVSGLTLGTVRPADPEEKRFERAARAYLDGTERTNCKIDSGYLVVRLQYEFYFTCSDVI